MLQPENRLLLKEVGPTGEGRVSVIEQLLDEVSATEEQVSLGVPAYVSSLSLSDGSSVQCCDYHRAS